MKVKATSRSKVFEKLLTWWLSSKAPSGETRPRSRGWIRKPTAAAARPGAAEE